MSFMKPQIESFEQSIGNEYQLCQDCHYTIHNGEPDEPSSDWSPNWESIPNNLTGKSMDDCGNEFENEGYFSHSGCDCCNNGLAVTVYDCVDVDSIQTESKYRWRLSAPGFLDCTDWAVADSIAEAIDDCLGMYGDGFDLDDLNELATHIDYFDDFKNAYIEAIEFTEQIEDCWNQLDEQERLELTYDCIGFICSFPEFWEHDMERAGHDFWLTRNGHGAGFWDGDWEQKIGQRATDASKRFGEIWYPQFMLSR